MKNDKEDFEIAKQLMIRLQEDLKLSVADIGIVIGGMVLIFEQVSARP